jgi:hypothetical protein
LREAVVWEQSYITSNANYARSVRRLQDAVKTMRANYMSQLVQFSGPARAPYVRSSSQHYARNFQPHANRLLAELQRLNGIPAARRTAVETGMLGHLRALQPRIIGFRTEFTGQRFSQANTHLNALMLLLQRAYEDLPEEVDARAAGAAARQQFAQPAPARRASPTP